jgi:predicted RND superfamily exporter protein
VQTFKKRILNIKFYRIVFVPQDNSVEERLSEAIAEAAAAITITSITTMLAFVVSSFTSLPAVSWFCIYAALATWYKNTSNLF